LLIKIIYQILKVYWFLVRPVTLGVRILMVKDAQFLLVKHSYQDEWYLPGGGVKRGETLEQAILREAFEECGARINQIQFLGIFSSFVEYKSDHISLFLSEDFTLKEVKDHEIEQLSFFSPEQLPNNLSPGSRRKIEAYINESLETSGEW
jgi:8-oxo-dGTP pyrophosphatase MutT (NUDIX family)